jgi:hypothetical protein
MAANEAASKSFDLGKASRDVRVREIGLCILSGATLPEWAGNYFDESALGKYEAVASADRGRKTDGLRGTLNDRDGNTLAQALLRNDLREIANNLMEGKPIPDHKRETVLRDYPHLAPFLEP